MTKIAHSIAYKAWNKAGEGNFKGRILYMRDDLYKKVFASFYHDTAYVKLYEDTYKNSSESVKNSNTLFFDEILKCSEEAFMKKMSVFVNKEINKKVLVDHSHQDDWSNCLREEKLNPKKPQLYGYHYLVWPFSAL